MYSRLQVKLTLLPLIISLMTVSAFSFQDQSQDAAKSNTNLTNEESVKIVNQARALNKEKKFEEAIALMNELLKKQPQNTLALLTRSESYRLSRKLDLSFADLEKVSNLSTSNEGIWGIMGIIRFEQGRHKEAVVLMSKSIDTKPDNQQLRLLRGVSYIEIGEAQKAYDDLSSQMTVKKPSPYFLLYLSISQSQLGRNKDALKSVSKALELNPDYGEALFARAQYNYDFDNWEEILIDTNKLLEKGANNPLIFALNGEALIKSGEYVKGIEKLDKAIAAKPKRTAWIILKGLTFGDLGDYERAIEFASRALEIDPKEETALNNRAFANLRLGKLDAAEKDIKAVLAINPKSIIVLSNRALLNLKKKNTEQAQRDAFKVLDSGGNYAETFYNLGLIYLEQDKLGIARAQFDKAISLKPDFVLAYQMRAKVLNALGSSEEGAKDVSKAKEIQEKRDRILEQLK